MFSFTEITSKKAIRQIEDYLVLDIVTTGPDPETDRIIALGMARVTGGEIVNTARTLINPEKLIPAQVAEASGIADADVAEAPVYEDIAPSIAGLVNGAVLVTESSQLAFLRVLLDSCPEDGQVQVINLPRFARAVLPKWKDGSLQDLAASLSIEPEGADVLANCALRHEILRECAARSAEDAAKKAAQAARRGGKKRRPAEEPLTNEEKLWWSGTAICLVLALFFLPNLTALLPVLAAAVFCPARPLRRWLAQWKLDGWKLAVIGGALILLALVIRPASGKQQGDAEVTPPPYIILSWNELGDYGKATSMLSSDGALTDYIAFYLPPGNYRILNNGAAAATVAVYGGEDENAVPPETEEETEGETDDAEAASEPKPLSVSDSSSSVTVLGNKSKEITVGVGQFVLLADGDENVIFQYLSPLPEKEETEEEQEDEEAQAVVAYVVGEEVRLRKSASVSAFIMGTFDTGKEVLVTGTVGDWYAVTVDNQKGYIYSKYVSFTQPDAVS